LAYKSDIEKANRISEAKDFPRVILIDNFNGCNLRCFACDHKNVSKYRPIQTMPISLYKKIIDEIAVKDPYVRVWEIFFGEPFLCKDMDMRIKYAKDRGLKDVVLNTNGNLMPHDKIRSYIQAGLDAIYVGIDAATEESYNKIRIGGDLDKVIKNVLEYRDLLRQFGDASQKLFVQFVLSDVNEHEVEEFKEFWKKKGVDIKIRPKVSWAGFVDAPNLSPNESLIRRPCYWIMQTINICADGEVALCSVDMHCIIKCGNVKEKSIEEIWHDKLKEYRAMHRESRFDKLPELCRKCRDWQSAYAEFY